MERNRPITEDDLLLTELLLARSYGNLKKSVVRTSFDVLGAAGESVGGTIKRHPYAAAGAAAGTGLLLFGIVAFLVRGWFGGRRDTAGKDRPARPGPAMDILSMLVPVVMPYVTAYLEKYLGRTFSRAR